VDLEARLRQVVDFTPFRPSADTGCVYAFAQPVPPDQAIWDRALASAGSPDALREALADAAKQVGGPPHVEVAFKRPTYWHQQGADAWRLSTDHNREPDPQFIEYLTDLTLNIDGRGVLFFGGAAHTFAPNPNLPEQAYRIIYEAAIAENLAGFLAFMGALFAAASYLGPVDLGLNVVGLDGAVSAATLNRMQFPSVSRLPTYNAPTYPRTERLGSAAELAAPEQVARRMLQRLLETTTQREDFDPFTAD
jgi:hypothetical protein